MDPNGPTMTPGPPGMPTPPGWMGMTPAAFGYGAGPGQMLQSQQIAGSMFAGNMMNTAVGAGTAGLNAMQFGAMTAAPLLASHGSTLGMRALGTAWSFTDPFQMAMLAGRGGWAMAEGAGMGMAGRLALGGLGMTGVGLPLLAASQIPFSWAEHTLAGARNAALGGSTLRAVAPTAFPGRSPSGGQGASFGMELSQLSREMGTSTDELAQLTRQLDQMKVFQSTRSVSEFRSKFREVLGAIKEIASSTKQSIEEATQTFGELRQQGFYTTADITAQAAKRAAQSATSGVSQQDLSQYGAMGSQYARSMGMRGRFGADFMSQNVASMASAYRNMTDDQRAVVDEYGGPEALGASLAAKQMRFLSSARGRAVIAATLGANNRPDPERMGQLLSGNMTTEAIVETAAGRGLGVLSASGDPRVREQYMQYAGPMQLMMAASQARQLYGGYNMNSLSTMMGTMGYNRDETRTLLAQTMQMPRVLEEQANAQTLEMQRDDYAARRKQSSWWGGLKKEWGHYTNSWERSGGRAMAGLQDAYERTANALAGYEEISTGAGGIELARGFLRRGGRVGADAGTRYTGGAIFGPDSERDRIRQEYGAFTQTGMRLAGREGRADRYRIGGKEYDAADVIELSAGSTGDEIQLITREKLAEAESVRPDQISREAIAKAKEHLGYSDYMQGSLLGSAFGWSRLTYDKGKLGQNMDADVSYYKHQASIRKLDLSSEDVAAFAALKKSGAFSGDLESFAAAKKNNPKDFQRWKANAGVLMKSAGASDEEVERRLGTSGATGRGLSREGAKRRLEEGFSTFLKEGGQKNWLGFGGEALQKEVTDNSEVAAAFNAYMKAKGPGTERTAALDRLKDLLGEDSAAFGDIKRIAGMDETDQAAFNKVEDLLGQHFAAQALGARSDREKKAILAREGRVMGGKQGKRSAAEEEAIQALLQAGSTDADARTGAYAKLYKSMSGDGFSEEEKGFLTEITGGAEAAEMADVLEKAAAGDKKALTKLGVEEKALEGQKDKLAAVIEAAVKSGTLDPALITKGGTQTNVAGSHESYVETNTRFVTAVTTFVNMLGEKFPQLQTAGDGVTQAGGSLSVGGFSVGWSKR